MFSWQHRISVKFFNHLKRYQSKGSLVIKNDSKDAVLHLPLCVKSKTRKIKDNDPEDIWLKNLNLENLKLYRKTSFGIYLQVKHSSCHIINAFKIFQADFDNKESVDKLSKNNVKCEPVLIEEKRNVLASPHMCQFLIENMVTFPLLKSQCHDSLESIIKNEEELDVVDIKRYPSVTSILQETMSPENKERLDKWELGMIQKMGPEKFKEYKQDPAIAYENYPCDKVFIRPSRKRKQIIVDIFHQGSKFHGALRKYLESREERIVSIDQSIEGCWNSVAKVLEDINNVVMVEEAVHHPILSYKGYVDCVASYRDVPYVIEWKRTARKVKSISKLYDAPVQACAYLGALSWRKDLIQTVPKKCLLVIAYVNGDPADVFPLCLEQCQVYWSDFTHRLQSFWARKWSDLNSNKSQL